jgi:DNA-binding GntR family transcriptional regulator
MHEPLAPLRRESTASIIADQLRASIMEGRFAPGQQMSEVALAQQLDVSRGLLREAMQRLVQEGLLRSERYRGLFVIELGTDDVRDIYLAREAVERAAVQALIRRREAGATDPLFKIVKRMETAANSRRASSLAQLDLKFHAQLVESSGSPRLKRVMGSLLVETQMCLNRLPQRYPDPAELVAEHRELLAAIFARDEPRALDLVRAHMADAVERLAQGTDDPV